MQYLKNKVRIIAGILTTGTFLGVLFILFIFKSGSFPKLALSPFQWDIFNFRQAKTKYSVPQSILKQEIVQEESSLIDVVDKVSPAVVSIVVTSYEYDYFSGPIESEQGIGTGFIVDANGLIVTNSHVVDAGEEYKVVLKDGTSYDVNKVHLDSVSDIAILEITARNLPTVTFGDSDSLKVGQRAIAIGNALGRYQNTVTVGVVSGVARQLRASGTYGENEKIYENALQTDAAINPGNSGGPLLNSSGQVIGINVATTIGANSISFAIPVNTLKPILEGFIVEGKIIKPMIGVQYVTITKEIAALRNMPQGAFISGVLPDTPGEKAGLKRGDIITKIDERVLDDTTTLVTLISTKKVGDIVVLTVDRDGTVFEVRLTLEAAPEN